jgi:hypothetical protein
VTLEALGADAGQRRRLFAAREHRKDKSEHGETNDSREPNDPDQETERVTQHGFHPHRTQFP